MRYWGRKFKIKWLWTGPEFLDLMIDGSILAVAATFAKSPSIFRGLKS